MRIPAAGFAFAAAALALVSGSAVAQEVVAYSDMPVAAGDMAKPALAQLNDAADSAAAQKKIDLYKQLMQLNGVTRGVRTALDATKAQTRLVVLERAGKSAMTPAEEARYNTVADAVLKETEANVLDSIARSQSQSFSADEIQQLINANASVAAAKYNAGKFVTAQNSTEEVQNYMVQAVVKIIKTFKDSVDS
ncbi:MULTISPECIES: hypothetical protein [Asticcacaulis]|uniref:hypothetical protein n=1 Tax=Asticcacaulis TaxID=76890 RepID=UPI001FD8DA5A|nr:MULTISPECIES: hypothetical protein [Asticcacaulis]MBP2158019.1 hypothetical protein [Asticcacaulis solisilvae]MDR6799064.1 hypothetical protein [Asticcacaulis sp. BE141]